MINNRNMTKANLMYVEDDESLRFVTSDNLAEAGFRVSCFSDGQAALEAFGGDRYDLCILDVMLPEMDGFTLAGHIRRRDPEVPILFLTARSMEEDRLHGLRIGGDDYLTKPFSLEELILKIEIFLKRRKVVASDPHRPIALGSYSFDPVNHSLVREGQQRQLTQRENDLLLYLCQHANRVLKRSDILLAVWGSDDYFLGRSLDVFISRLRKYLKHDPGICIETLHGIGFRFLTESSLID